MTSKASARDQLIATQRQLVEKTKSEIYESLGAPGEAVKAYYQEYRRELFPHQGPVEREELYRALDEANIVYFGDYHTLRESQKAPLRILDEMMRRRRRLPASSGRGMPMRSSTLQ